MAIMYPNNIQTWLEFSTLQAIYYVNLEKELESDRRGRKIASPCSGPQCINICASVYP